MSTSELPSCNYRGTSLGTTLLDALDELVVAGKIPTQLAMRVLQEFDKSAVKNFAVVRGKATAKGHLHTYRQVEDVWRLDIRDATFRMDEGGGTKTTVESARVKIVAQKSETAVADSNSKRR